MNKVEMTLSQKVREIPEALSVYINQLVYNFRRQKRDLITLSLGESFFEIPVDHDHLCKLLSKSGLQDFNGGLS